MEIKACPDFSGVQTIYNTIKEHGGVPIAIGMKVNQQLVKELSLLSKYR